jgi:endonuclease/exonuclease/phosphatase family metal-dependent hydrolase
MQRFSTRLIVAAVLAVCAGATQVVRLSAAADVVLYASGASRSGNWSSVSDSTAAGGTRMSSADNGWSSTGGALASPADYFELSFSAEANTPYHVWVRLKAGANSKYNDSVYLQWNDSVDSNGSALYRIGSTSAMTANLQTCSGCSLSNWGWVDGAYWLSQSTTIRFANSGSHTIRVQTREDGVSVDQIVLGAVSYLSNSPGQSSDDSTIIPNGTATPTASVSAGSTPYSGTPAAIPGTINAADYDRGGEAVAFHDSGPTNNAGGEYRSEGVDIESSSEGGYDVGWTAAGEWLNYTVNVASAGSYTAQLRVASMNGSTLHVGFNGSPSVWASVSVPSTGGWQDWTTVTVPVTLGAGRQTLTLMFDTGGVNIRYIKLVAGSTSTPTPTTSTSSGPYNGSPAPIPGKVTAAYFDNGGEGVAYHDTTSGNSGGAVRSTDVDIESSSEGGSDIGWTAAGEWLNYTVSVGSSGSYTAQLRVASPNGGSLHIGFNGPSSVWSAVSVPSTGDWQSWTTVNVPVTLGAGQQKMTLMLDSSGVNISYVNVVAGSTAPPPTVPTSGGTTLTMADWNLQIDDPGGTHARVAMDLLMAMGPRPKILTVQEAHGSQYGTYIDELQSQTGQTWYGTYKSHCPPGAFNGSSCSGSEDEGVAIFSSYPIIDTGYIYLFGDAWHSARVAVRAALNVNGVTVQVFSVHLQPNNSGARYTSMANFRSWASNFSRPQLVGGDFNADPDQIDTDSGMNPSFVDTWSVAGSGGSLTAFLPDPFMKIDYIFADTGGRAAVQASWVPTSTGSWSDHRPVLTTFTIR